MKFLTRLFKGKKAGSFQENRLAITPEELPSNPATKSLPHVNFQERAFPLTVVGERFYTDGYNEVIGAHSRDGYNMEIEALIELEPTNEHDPNAVCVSIYGRKAGYLPRDQALRVSSQMKEEGLQSALCRARVLGGWRKNQHSEGDFQLRLAIPAKGWIDFGTGRTKPDWNSEPMTVGSKTLLPVSNSTGPLKGERVSFIGLNTDSDLAKELADNGARILAGVGKSATIVVVAEEKPFSPGLHRSRNFKLAQEMKDQGLPIKILSQSEARRILLR